MVEMMLMQNAQMHQIIMQNMMLKALPPMGFSQPAGASYPLPQHTQQVTTLEAEEHPLSHQAAAHLLGRVQGLEKMCGKSGMFKSCAHPQTRGTVTGPKGRMSPPQVPTGFSPALKII